MYRTQACICILRLNTAVGALSRISNRIRNQDNRDEEEAESIDVSLYSCKAALNILHQMVESDDPEDSARDSSPFDHPKVQRRPEPDAGRSAAGPEP